MINYASTKGGISPVPFDEAVLQGFAADGGLFVPDAIPEIGLDQLQKWSELSYTDLAFEILSLFIDPSIIPPEQLKRLLNASFEGFEHPETIPLVKIKYGSRLHVLELFHGPTLSFKDVAMGFLINTLDYLLGKRGERLSIVLATTGDTGPAAAHAAAGKPSIDCWPLYPKGMISEEQERQMTTLDAGNIHPVGVEHCADGGDDLDLVVARLFSDPQLKQRLKLSSVNSINWCRVMVQTIHYFYGYFQAVGTVGEKVCFSIPSGAFGNLFGGYLAKSMGLPAASFICATNKNQTLFTAFSKGIFRKYELQQSVSSAIDIVVPYNFWRFLYFNSGRDPEKIRAWMERFAEKGEIHLDDKTLENIRNGYRAISISDEETLATMKSVFERSSGYLLDPHGAVAVAAAAKLEPDLEPGTQVVCLATAHPAKFPDIIQRALETGAELPPGARHHSLEEARHLCQRLRLCDCSHLEPALIDAMTKVVNAGI